MRCFSIKCELTLVYLALVYLDETDTLFHVQSSLTDRDIMASIFFSLKQPAGMLRS